MDNAERIAKQWARSAISDMATRKQMIKDSVAEWDAMFARRVDTPRQNRATVVKAYGRIDQMGCATLYVDLSNGMRLSPYFNQSPERQERTEIERDGELWAAGMAGATEWESWDWIES